MATNFKSMKKEELIEAYYELFDDYEGQLNDYEFWLAEEDKLIDIQRAVTNYIETKLIPDLRWYLSRHNAFSDEIADFLNKDYNPKNLKALALKIVGPQK